MIPVTRYAQRAGADLAYKAFGEGERDIVLVFAFISNVDVFNNNIGLNPAGGGIVSFLNNKVTQNGTNGAPTATVNPI